MAHYAILDENNIVISVFVGKDEGDEGADDWEVYYGAKRTSYNTVGGVHSSGDNTKAFRKNYAGIGYTYDADRDAFIPPQPFPSWTLNESSCLWEPPIPQPTDRPREWNEASQSWDSVG